MRLFDDDAGTKQVADSLEQTIASIKERLDQFIAMVEEIINKIREFFESIGSEWADKF